MRKFKSFAPYLTEAVLPFMFARGYVPNAAGEIVTHGDEEYERFEKALSASLDDAAKFQTAMENRAKAHVFTFKGCAVEQTAEHTDSAKPERSAKRHPLNPAAVHDLMRFGFLDEGRAFTVAGDHSLTLVRAAVRDLGGDWRLWASVEDDGGEGRPPRFRCVVGRADPWSYPSSVEAAGETHGKGPQVTAEITGADLMRGVLEKATETATRGPDLYDSEAQRLAHVTSFDVPAFLREASDTLAKAIEDGTAMRTEMERVVERMAEFTRETLARLHALNRA